MWLLHLSNVDGVSDILGELPVGRVFPGFALLLKVFSLLFFPKESFKIEIGFFFLVLGLLTCHLGLVLVIGVWGFATVEGRSVC